MPASQTIPQSDRLVSRVADRLRWEIDEWRKPSAPSFVQEELDRALLDEIVWTPGQRVLDVGCGSGAYCTALRSRGVETIGVDLAFESLGRSHRAGHRVSQASALSLPFAIASFDAVMCHKTLYLLDPPMLAAAELARIVRPAGRVVFSTSNQASPYMRIQSIARGQSAGGRWRSANAWSASQWIAAFNGLGFRTSAVFSCNLVWPLVYRVCDTWLIPNEWMRRYTRGIRRITRLPLRTRRPLCAAQDYVIEMTKV